MPDQDELSPLRQAALGAGVPVREVRGYSLFAPPSERSFVELAGLAPGILVALNAEKLGRRDIALQRIVNANVGYPDGAGAVLALARKGVRAPRLAGADLWLHLVDCYAASRSLYLVGATSTVVAAAAARLSAHYPGAEINYRDGFLGPGDEDRLLESLKRAGADIVFVAMGSPRQEILMERLLRAHPALYVGLGGSFDVYVGAKARAPRWLQSAGLEWAYQFLRSPRRIPRLPAYLKFAWLLAVGRI